MSRRRVLIVGGAGVFGARLAEGLLKTTNAEILIAGRSLPRAEAARTKLSAHAAVALNRDTATAQAISTIAPFLVIDAAGPFQDGALDFPRAVIAAGAHYLDLADARDFVARFPELNAIAESAGVVAFSGASSTPALTHAALDALCAGWKRIDVIRAGIAPGNRAPRGRALVEAILRWTGAPLRVWRDGA